MSLCEEALHCFCFHLPSVFVQQISDLFVLCEQCRRNCLKCDSTLSVAYDVLTLLVSLLAKDLAKHLEIYETMLLL